jgi:DNA-directed RNA polymerase
MRTEATLKSPLLGDSIIREQIALETKAISQGVDRYRKAVADATRRGEVTSLKPVERLMVYWHPSLTRRIILERRRAKRGRGNGVGLYRDILTYGAPRWAQRLSILTMYATFNAFLQGERDQKSIVVANSVGRAVFTEMNHIAAVRDPDIKVSDYLRRYRVIRPAEFNHWYAQLRDDGRREAKTRISLGAMLFGCLMETATIDGELVFHRVLRRVRRHRIAYILADPSLYDVIDEGHRARETMRPRHWPMLCPPVTWTYREDGTIQEGGYLKVRTAMVSKMRPTQRAALERTDLGNIFHGLNCVNAPAQQIDRHAHWLIEECRKRGWEVSTIPPRDNVPMPPEVASTDEMVIRANKSARSEAYARNIALSGLREEFEQRLTIARELKDRRAIYVPHHLDFTGRAYPEPHLNHQGDDVSRSLFRWSRPRPLDDGAVRALYIHVANTFGFDKATFDERIAWTEDHMAEVTLAATKPLEFPEVWRDADKPFQFAAAAYALHKFREGNTEPAEHLSAEIDGTCNGLQHYAALGLDPEGARAVNLTPCERPQRIYRDGVDRILPQVEQDARWMPHAKLILPILDDDLIKQPFMTTVYGVTAIGARKQLTAKMLKAFGINPHECRRRWVMDRMLERAGVDPELFRDARKYLPPLVFTAIRETCPKAVEIMNWLERCADAIVTRRVRTKKGRMERIYGRVTVEYEMPVIGFPVSQPYRAMPREQIRTALQDIKVAWHEAETRVKGGTQRRAFAPNYVHTLDAAHMFMTAIRSHGEGIDFAGIHDCYRSHLADIGRVGRLAREEFCRLHQSDLLVKLGCDLQDANPHCEIPEPPDRGTFRLADVLDAEYAFS